MLLDFINAMIAYIQSNVSDIPTINLDIVPFDQVNEGLTFRLVPSSPETYYAGANDYNIAFQLIYKEKGNVEKMIGKMSEITFLLDAMINNTISTPSESFCFIKNEVTTLPNFVDKTDKQEYIYTAVFNSVVQKN